MAAANKKQLDEQKKKHSQPVDTCIVKKTVGIQFALTSYNFVSLFWLTTTMGVFLLF